ncbi:hypothetical protein [Arthrobacter sp. efr-133-TYG-118]|uniref:hypothetical protein n=1 Tax=Arthrobacter sp. efr-133-TYG-118 TaxID=3040279 RepID=UPI002551156B|nr:hypothetical protein [Arthrobacter sp. efr-133-TYG-118]
MNDRIPSPATATHRDAETWPTAKSKAKRRHLTRKKVARAGQDKRDAAQRGV